MRKQTQVELPSHAPEQARIKPEFDKHGEALWPENPFWEGMRIKTRSKRTQIATEQQVLMTLETGEINGAVEVSKVYEIDPEAFVKVYTQHLRVFLDLGQQAIKLYPVILDAVSAEKNKDKIYLSHGTAERFHEINTGKSFPQASYYRGRKELIAKGIIAPTTDANLYWINPRLFWNGDRVKFITELRRGPQILPPQREH